MYLSHQGLVIFKWFFRSYTIFLCLFLLQTLVILLWLRYLIQTYTCFRYFSVELKLILFVSVTDEEVEEELLGEEEEEDA